MSEMSRTAKIAGLVYCIFLSIFIIAAWPACSNPYIDPQTSKAVSERDQLEESKKQNELLQKQNQLLERIAIAIEKK